MSLKTDYTNDIFSGNRKYNMITNSDGTVSFTDVTEYTSEGDTFSASDINSVNEVINALDTKIGSSTLETAAQDLSDAVNEVNSNKAQKSHASSDTIYGLGSIGSYGHVKTINGLNESAYDYGCALSAYQGYVLNQNKAPKSHASSEDTYGLGTTGSYGHVKTVNGLTTSTHTNGLALSAAQGYVLNQAKAPNSHASTASTYGLGTSVNYGHVKTINNLTTSAHADGNALSAYQGYLLNEKIENATDVKSVSLDSIGFNNMSSITSICSAMLSNTTVSYAVADTDTSVYPIANAICTITKIADTRCTIQLVGADNGTKNPTRLFLSNWRSDSGLESWSQAMLFDFDYMDTDSSANDYLYTGIYYNSGQNNVVGSLPTGISDYSGILEVVEGGTTGVVFQKWTPRTASNSVYRRTLVSGIWSDWYAI